MLNKRAIAAYEDTAGLSEIQPDLPMFFRPMYMGDAPEVHAIETEVFPFPWSESGFQSAVSYGYHCWVMCEEDSRRIVGYFVLMTSIDEGHLMTIGLARRYQGMGYGRMLLDRAIQTAREHGMATMLLEVRPSNYGPLSMYRKYGFQQIGLRKHYYPDVDNTREDAIVMRLML